MRVDAMKLWAIVLALLVAPTLVSAAHAQDAETRVYGAAQTCTGLRAYLRNYPNGRFIADARARVARECPADTAAPAPRPTATKTVPAPVIRTPPADPCVQARADWANIATTRDIPVLRAFRDNTPAACAVQRAQAQVRIDAIEGEKRAAADSVARKRAEWNGVPEFDGTWVLDRPTTPACSQFPWRFEPSGNEFKFIRDKETGYRMRVESTNPPTLVRMRKDETDARMTYVNGKIRRTSAESGEELCILRRQ